ncbi:hypothetical protein KCP73_22655 [Salmonella enterica subsp. enterica]|nr:hypothetical protein KCP73_22655 [Salmonella enterica subsp. enterica]
MAKRTSARQQGDNLLMLGVLMRYFDSRADTPQNTGQQFYRSAVCSGAFRGRAESGGHGRGIASISRRPLASASRR